jgi:hypothetical protein
LTPGGVKKKEPFCFPISAPLPLFPPKCRARRWWSSLTATWILWWPALWLPAGIYRRRHHGPLGAGEAGTGGRPAGQAPR